MSLRASFKCKSTALKILYVHQSGSNIVTTSSRSEKDKLAKSILSYCSRSKYTDVWIWASPKLQFLWGIPGLQWSGWKICNFRLRAWFTKLSFKLGVLLKINAILWVSCSWITIRNCEVLLAQIKCKCCFSVPEHLWVCKFKKVCWINDKCVLQVTLRWLWMCGCRGKKKHSWLQDQSSSRARGGSLSWWEHCSALNSDEIKARVLQVKCVFFITLHTVKKKTIIILSL